MIEEWQLFPTLSDVDSYFRHIVTVLNSEPWSLDFEATLDRQVVCLGLWPCRNPTVEFGLCIPFLKQGGERYWSGTDELAVLDLVTTFMTDPSRKKIGQNTAGYDTGVPPFDTDSLMFGAWGIHIAGLIGDTMALHHLCFSELKHSLAFQASIATDLGPFKEEIHQPFPADDDEGSDEVIDEEDDSANEWARVLEKPDRQLRTYNLYDCFSTAVIWNGLCIEAA